MGFTFDQFAKVFNPILVAFQLVAVAFLFVRVRPFPNPPPQEISNFTGLPIWATSSPHFLAISEKTDITEYIAALITGIAALVCLHVKLSTPNYTRRQHSASTSSSSTSSSTPSTEEIVWTKLLFNTIITGYIIATFIALVAAVLFQLGKLWASFGIYHNVMELCMMAALLTKGSFNYVAGLVAIVVYSITVMAATSQLDWYWDSLFFKVQGLTIDFILPLLFFRIARNTYNLRRDESRPLLENDPIQTSSIAPQSQLNTLFIAALVHLLGNIANIVGNNMELPTIIFNLSYFIAFPMYTFYVHQAEKTRTTYVVPSTSKYELLLIFLWGASASTICGLIALGRL